MKLTYPDFLKATQVKWEMQLGQYKPFSTFFFLHLLPKFARVSAGQKGHGWMGALYHPWLGWKPPDPSRPRRPTHQPRIASSHLSCAPLCGSSFSAPPLTRLPNSNLQEIDWRRFWLSSSDIDFCSAAGAQPRTWYPLLQWPVACNRTAPPSEAASCPDFSKTGSGPAHRLAGSNGHSAVCRTSSQHGAAVATCRLIPCTLTSVYWELEWLSALPPLFLICLICQCFY